MYSGFRVIFIHTALSLTHPFRWFQDRNNLLEHIDEPLWVEDDDVSKLRLVFNPISEVNDVTEIVVEVQHRDQFPFRLHPNMTDEFLRL